jgi:hypothetical protein
MVREILISRELDARAERQFPLLSEINRVFSCGKFEWLMKI